MEIASLVNRKIDLRNIILNPIIAFIAVWTVQFILYSLLISSFLPHDSKTFLNIVILFFISAVSFVIGYFVSNALPAIKVRGLDFYKIQNRRMYFCIFLLSVVIVLISLVNVFKYGPLPFFVTLNRQASEYNYLNYGQLKYFVFSSAMLMMALVPFVNTKILKAFAVIFSIAVFILYVSRGFLVQAILQYFIVRFMKNNKISNLKICASLLGIIVLIVLIMGFVGSFRTGNTNFLNAMQINEEYRHWPIGILWVISYISSPLSNIASLIDKNFDSFGYGSLTFYRILPPFAWPLFNLQSANDMYQQTIVSYFPNPLNNVPTYLGLPFIDFGWMGIIVYNFFIGSVMSIYYRRVKRIAHYGNILIFAILMSSLVLIFFENLFFNLTNIVQLIIAWVLVLYLAKSKERKHSV